MDGFGYRAEAASIWRQMILVLKRRFDDAPSEHRVHLGVSWAQYGMFLLVCGRHPEAKTAEDEAAVHGAALCDAGIATFIAPMPIYYGYRQQSLHNIGDYRAACADAAKLVDYSRSLCRLEGTRHAERLALALLWHRASLMKISCTSEAYACLDEAALLVQSGTLLDAEANISAAPPSASRAENSTHVPNLPQPLRFKILLARGFDILWEIDGDSHNRVIAAQASAVACARHLSQISPAEHAQLLYRSLRNYGFAFWYAEEYEDACDADAEAVRIARERCRLHPGQYLEELADCLAEYGSFLDCREMYEAACDAKLEAVNITRELCRFHPGKHDADLADHLESYGMSLHSRGMHEAACDAEVEAVNVMHELCRLHPGKHDADLARRLESSGTSLHSRKMYSTACDIYTEAVNITHELCRMLPGGYQDAFRAAFESTIFCFIQILLALM